MFIHRQPLSKIEGLVVYYYYNDHLATLQKMTDDRAGGVGRERNPSRRPHWSLAGTITNNSAFLGSYDEMD